MPFTHDTTAALICAAALVNTLPQQAGRTDALATVADLDSLLDEHEMTGRRDRDAAELESVQALRGQLRALWTTDEDDAVRTVNALLADAAALPRLVRHGDWGYHLHATDPEATLATRLAVEAAMAFVDVIRGAEMHRLRVCAADDCEHVVVDLSKNRSRRYCESGCGTRLHAAAYRARRFRAASTA